MEVAEVAKVASSLRADRKALDYMTSYTHLLAERMAVVELAFLERW